MPTTNVMTCDTLKQLKYLKTGQQVVEEILDVQRPGCPREFFNIPVPRDNKLFNPDQLDNLEMPLQRSRFDQRTGQSPSNPRQQVTQTTSVDITQK